MTAEVWMEVINRALLAIGNDSIGGLDDGEAGRVVGQLYESAIDYTLEMQWWNAATEFAVLAETTAPAFRWPRAWALPADPYCLVITGFNKDYPDTVWQLNKRTILTEEINVAQLEFVGRPQSPHGLNEMLLDSIVAVMAAKFVMRLTEDTNRKKDIVQAMEVALRRNRGLDDRLQGSSKTVPASAIVVSRGQGPFEANAARWA